MKKEEEKFLKELDSRNIKLINADYQTKRFNKIGTYHNTIKKVIKYNCCYHNHIMNKQIEKMEELGIDDESMGLLILVWRRKEKLANILIDEYNKFLDGIGTAKIYRYYNIALMIKRIDRLIGHFFHYVVYREKNKNLDAGKMEKYGNPTKKETILFDKMEKFEENHIRKELYKCLGAYE